MSKTHDESAAMLANLMTTAKDENFYKSLRQIMTTMDIELTGVGVGENEIEFIVKTEDDVRMLENCFKKVTSTIKLTVTIDDLVLQ